jgi:hypothetical protein
MAEKKVIELEVKTESFKPLKAQLREAQQAVIELSEKFGATSQEAINAAKRASELKDAIADAKDLTDAFNPDAKFNALSNSIGGALNGFQAFEGALGLVGVESEDLQKTLLKVQSAMALSQGLQGVMEAKDSFKQLGAVVGDAFKGMTTASKAFALTGIGLLITGVGLLISNFDKLKETFFKVNQGTAALKETLGDYRKGAQEAIQATTEVGNSFEMARKGVISKEEALHVYNTTLGDTFGKAKNLNEAEDLYNKKTKAYIEATALRAQAQALLGKAAEAQAEALTAGLDAELTAAQNVKVALVMNTQGVEAGAKLTKKYLEENAKESKKLAEERAKILTEESKRILLRAETIEKENKIISKSEKETNDYLTEQRKAAAEKAKELRDKELEAQKAKLEAEKKLAEDRAAFLLEQEALDEIRQEQAYARRLEEEAKMLEEELAIEQAARERREAEEAAEELRQEERFKREQERRARNKEFAFKTAQDTLSLISAISELYGQKGEKQAKRAFEIQKAASIASAVISTYQSAVSAYQSQFVPIPDPSSPIRGAVAAGIAVATGLANVAKIASQKFEGGGAAGGGAGNVTAPSGGAGGSVISPNFNIVGNAQATNPLAGLGTQPLQAYVVSGEVTTAQSLDRNRINYATFG